MNCSITHLIICLFCLILVQNTAFSQNARIKGKITDGKEILSYATISLETKGIGTSSDHDGNFLLENIIPGQYTVVASFVGYDAQKKSVTLSKGQTAELYFVLSSSKTLEEVVVTGTMKPTFVSNSPIKVDVITSKQLDTYIPAAASSVVEGIQLINGVQEVVACGVCFTNSISINGLNGAYTAVLMDGTPMFGNLASVYGLNGIPNMIIDRFEVIKGPSSTLYGSEAVAGVINIITKNPEKEPLLSVDLMGTSHKESFGNIAVAPKIGKSKGFIGLNYAYVNDFDDINKDNFGDGISMDRYSLFTKWDIHRKSGKKFSLSAKYYYEDRRNGVEDFLTDRAYRTIRGSDQIYGESIYTNRAELFGTYVLNTQANMKLDFSLSNHDQDSYYGSDYYKASQQIAYANYIWNLEKDQHDIIIGATARYNAYDDNTVATELAVNDQETINAPDNQFIPGIFIQDEFTVNEKLTMLGGARLDHYNSHGLIFSPRLNLKYKPSVWTTIRTNFGTGFRTVNLFTEDHAFITGQRTVEIRESLNPEKSYNASLNVNTVYAVFGGSGNIDLEAYYTHFTNKIIPDYNTTGKIIYGNSDGYARTMGIGMTINHSFAFPLSFNLGGNIQRATETEPNDLGINEVSDIAFAPKWSGVLTTNYYWKKLGLTIAYTARLTGKMALPVVFDLDENGVPLSYPRPTESEAFHLHNLQLNKKVNDKLSIYAGIQNLTNYRQLSSPLIGYNDPNAFTGFSNYFDTSYAYAPNHGREFYLGFKWNMRKHAKT